MSARVTLATASRVLAQLRRDPRTIALIMLVPIALETLLRFVFDHRLATFQHVGGPLLGLFPFISMFVVTSVTMLRERTTGTLERLMTLPLGKLDLLLGYALAFAAAATAQALAVSGVAFGLLGLDVAGSVWAMMALAIANAVLGMSLGLFVSAFAATEFQAVQFLPAFAFPQLLLCGLFAPRSDMAATLEIASGAFPLTYAYNALARVASGEPFAGGLARDVAVIVVGTLLALGLGALTLRRRTP